MALIGPYRVRINPHVDFRVDLIGERLVYGVSGFHAADLWLRWRLRVLPMGVRTRYWREGVISSERLLAWRVCVLRSSSGSGGGLGREWHLHGVDRFDARSRASGVLGCSEDDLFVEPADDFLVLESLPNEELEWLCRMVWRGQVAAVGVGRSGCRRLSGARVTSVRAPGRRPRARRGGCRRRLGFRRFMHCAWRRSIRPSARRRFRAMLLLGGELPKQAQGTAIARTAWELHGRNIPRDVIEACLEAGFRRKVEPFRADQRHALAAVARLLRVQGILTRCRFCRWLSCGRRGPGPSMTKT